MSGSVSGLAPQSGVAVGTGTGPQGAVTVPTTGTASIGDGIASVLAWLNRPFTTPMSPQTLFLVVGIIIISVLAWNMILYHLRLAAETVV